MRRARVTVADGSRSVLITGAGRGLGNAAALKLASSGWRVFAGVRNEADGQRMGVHPRITPVLLDVTNAEHLAALPSQLPEQLDALVNNAGVAVGGPVETLVLDEFRCSSR